MLLGGAAGSGDIVGPPSSLDRGILIFDGTTGKLVQDSTHRLYADSATDPTAPSPTIGDRYYNTVLNELLFFDGARAKFLSMSSHSLQAGRNGNTAAGSFYRGVDGLALNGTTRGIPVPKGTLISSSWSRTDADPATLDVLVSGAVIASLASSAVGAVRDDTIDANFLAGNMSFQNRLAGGNTTSNAQILVHYKRQA